MGSICAVLNQTNDIDRESVVRMVAASPHRGSLVEIERFQRCWLAVGEPDDHHETDLVVDRELAAAFNGSLDNIAELLALLERVGHAPTCRTPAGVLIACFKAFGRSFPNRLRGAFAGVVTDGHKMWAFRDHLGFRTLFFRDDGRAVFVASEAKQVLAGARIKRSPDADVLEKIFFSELLDEFPCALEGVKRLPKALVMEAKAHSITFERYWQPEPLLETGRYSPEEIAERFDSLLATAVERVLTGTDVVSLSGGIDSPPLAAYGMRPHLEMSGRPLSALSVVYPDQPSVDESEYVRAVADYLDMPLHTYERTAQPLSDLDKTVQLLDGPVPKIFVNDAEEHYHKARELGFRTMLTGEVAELVFDRRGFIVPHLLLRGRLHALGRNMRSQMENDVSLGNLGRQIASSFIPRPLAVGYRKRRMSSGSAPVPDFLDRDRFQRFQAESVVPTRVKWRQEQLLAFTGPGLTMEADEIMQNLCGIRTRRPWADVDLWEFFISLRAQDKAPEHGRKKLVRKLLRGKVPDVILDRKHKTGFDESILARIDYDSLRKWLEEPSFAMPGVDYGRLRERLADKDLGVADFMWAKDLAAVCAFVETA